MKIPTTARKDLERRGTSSLLRYEIGYTPGKLLTDHLVMGSRRRRRRSKAKCPAPGCSYMGICKPRETHGVRYQSVRAAALRVCDDLLHGQRLL